MCPRDEQIKNVVISGIFTAVNPTIRATLVLPFQPTLVEVTRVNYNAGVGVGEDTIYNLNSSLVVDPLTSVTCVRIRDENGVVVKVISEYNEYPRDIFNIRQPIQGEYSFTLNTPPGGSIAPNTTIQFAMNLRFTK